jgi:hypothetical protein
MIYHTYLHRNVNTDDDSMVRTAAPPSRSRSQAASSVNISQQILAASARIQVLIVF